MSGDKTASQVGHLHKFMRKYVRNSDSDVMHVQINSTDCVQQLVTVPCWVH